MVAEAREEFVCEKCDGTWAIEPEPAYPHKEDLERDGLREVVRVDIMHVKCPFCGSALVHRCGD